MEPNGGADGPWGLNGRTSNGRGQRKPPNGRAPVKVRLPQVFTAGGLSLLEAHGTGKPEKGTGKGAKHSKSGALPPLPYAPTPGEGADAVAAGMLDFAAEEHATKHALVLRPLSGTSAAAEDGGALQESVPVLVGAKRAWDSDAAFDPTCTGSYPSKSPAMFPLSDYVDTDGPDLPPRVHPFGWVPDRASSSQRSYAVRPSTGHQPPKTSTSMALELFDDPELEPVDIPKELAKLAITGHGGEGLPAASRFFDVDGNFKWAECAVVGYDKDNMMCTIRWASNGRTKQVKRLGVLLQLDDPSRFRFRLRTARRRRVEVEREARYWEFIANQPFTSPDILDGDFRERIMYLSGWAASNARPDVVEDVLGEVSHDYRIAVRQAIVDVMFQKPELNRLLAAQNVQPIGQRTPTPELAVVDLADFPDGSGRLVVSGEGWTEAVDVGLENFLDLYEDVAATLCSAQGDMLMALQEYMADLDIRELLLVDVELDGLKLPCQLEEFEDVQDGHISDLVDTLRNDWVFKVYTLVEPMLPSETDPEEQEAFYQAVADAQEGEPDLGNPHLMLMRYIKMVSLLMGDQLRTVCLNSLERYKELIEKFEIAEGGEAARAGYPPDGAEGAAACWGADMYCPEPPPLFTVKMVVEEGVCFLQPMLDTIRESTLAIFDNVLTQAQGIENIATKINQMGDMEGLATLEPDEPRVVAWRAHVEAIVSSNLVGPGEMLESFSEFSWLLEADEAEYAAQWKEAEHSLEETEAEIGRLAELAERVRGKSNRVVNFRLVQVDCSKARSTLAHKAERMRRSVQALICGAWQEKNANVCARFQAIQDRLLEQPTTTEAMNALETFMDAAAADLEELNEEIEESVHEYTALDSSGFHQPDEAFELYWNMRNWPSTISATMEETRRQLARSHKEYLEELKLNQSTLLEDMDMLHTEVDQFVELGEMEAVDERLAIVQDIEDRLHKYEELAELYNNREEIFQLPRTEYDQVDAIRKVFEPYANLWKICGEFTRMLPEWMDGPFTEIDAEALANDCDKWHRGTAKMAKAIEGPALDVVQKMRTRLEDFQVHIPLITALRNPGLRDRHWAQITERVGFPVRADAGFSVNRALQLELPKHLEAVVEVSEYASKEYSLERALDKMQGDWVGVEFATMAWRETGSSILRGLDDIQMLLDDQIVKTQSMRASPYIGPFEDRVKLFESKLSLTQDIIDQWLKCQSGWLYLEPIFGSPDIMQQMPNEGRKFKSVDTTWRRTMDYLTKNSEVMTVCSDEELLKNLTEANKLLDEVQKGLNEYLETKRLAFPRFYFLSNDELLEILSETKDPLRVQPFLRKIFEGINSLKFEADMEVTAMVSEENESVGFTKPFNPKNAGGNVERWLIDCENAMRDSLKHVLKMAFDAYAMAERTKWLLQWPGQVVICIGSMYWTAEVGDAIQAGTLGDYASQCTEELMKVVEKVRGKLTKLERKTLSALIVIDVHARDVATELANAGISTPTDFEWMSQLRYSWEDGEVIVRMINASIGYGYEYLGNGSRLVITPLTDRCYRTLMGALHLSLGGAPEGPAGTGKTETTKDLAKAIAMQCVVFNCSDGLDYLAMGKFFKGLASSGAWACFDEFNRIDLEVLSVIAQQILTMQRAKAQNLKVFEFEGTMLSLRPTFCVFITMNPGYAGRSELPDNLKALFRSVAMMVPDYALISEIMLYSSGYLEARDLARKLVATYKLCSEQLSSQSHYDYGMRAVISVLRAAAANKQKSGELTEDVLMLRSIKDVNAPKFLAPDVPLFEGILSDLFPGIALPETDYTSLDAQLVKAAADANVQATPIFLEKAHQLYEMILVRHGLMIVGYSYGSKTSIYKALATSLGGLEQEGGHDEHKVQISCMNPKSIYMGQLYGNFDPVSHEWQDGVLAKLFRDASVDTSGDRSWIMFDGPVDAIWIENMNTVLDDNKKLCLNSGEIIAMSAPMSMMFEVADLAVASPATVSRCGMVYMEPSELGWAPLLDSWAAALPLPASLSGRLAALLRLLAPVCLRFVRREITEATPTQDSAMMASGMRLLQGLMAPLLPEAEEGDDVTALTDALESLLIFSLVWSVGASAVNATGRAAFDGLLRAAVLGHLRKGDGYTGPSGEAYNALEDVPEVGVHVGAPMMPADGTVYDYYFDLDAREWAPWSATLDKAPIPPEAAVRDIIVPTVDTARYTFLLEQAVEHSYAVLLVGPTGTGKSVYTRRFLAGLPAERYVAPNCVTFSAQTTANMTQYLIDAKLDKRRKGLYGPPVGKRAVIFVDDLNMPALEVYGAQPPVELLRQFLDHGGWYARDNSFRAMADCQIVAAMGPPGGARAAVTARFIRHMNVVSVTEFSDAAMSSIFHAILQWNLRSRRFSPRVVEVSEEIVGATLSVYKTVQDALLPTPTKSFYLFNLRDMARVVAGLTQLAPRKLGGPHDARDSYLRAWVHEMLRVFYDRLVDEADQGWFLDLLRETLAGTFEVQLDTLLARLLPSEDEGGALAPTHLRSLFFGDYHSDELDDSGTRLYCEVAEPDSLVPLMEEFLMDYNGMSKKGMNLAIFLYAVEHLSRLARILRQPGGHALCVGLGGSGRQSLSRLAAFINGMAIHQVQITKSYGQDEWREDLKRITKSAGAEGKPAMFLFSDTQIKRETFVEDINNLLNSGEVPNMFPYDERAAVMEAARVTAKKEKLVLEGAQELWDYFVRRTQENLHLVICLSPVGDAFRERLRQFPSLVNCCTIDWFARWPPEALQAVAAKFMQDVELPADVRGKVITCCRAFHQETAKLCETFKQETGRINYVTPTSYVELIMAFKSLLASKRAELANAKARYENGLEKINYSAGQIAEMQEELAVLKPGLEVKVGESEVLMEKVAREKRDVVEPKKEIVDREVRASDAKAAEASEIKANCEAILAEAMPILTSAIKALDTIKPADIKLVESFKSPPATVKLVMEAVCVMLGEKPTPKADPDNPGKKVLDYWETSRKVMKEPGMVDRLKGYDRDNISPKIIEKIRKEYMTNPDFTPANAAKASSACEGMCRWIHAMDKYEEVAKVVAPKRAALAEAEAEYESVMTGLRAKQAELDTILAQLAGLEQQLADTIAEKNRLESEVELCAQKLERAEKLIGGLGGERERWAVAAEELGARFDLLTGDMLLSAGLIIYLGAFTATYRDSALASWAGRCAADAIPASPSFSLQAALGDPVKIREWAIAGLPSDGFSITNAIMVANSRRWPLMIDPQGQANKWVKQLERSHNVQVIKLTDGDYMRTMENAIQFGLPVLLENVKEELDPSLEPVLLRQTFKSGGVTSIQLGDAVMEYSDSFRFYMTTALRNPHYLPETSVKVMLLNFMITTEGLADQLVGVVVTQERPDLEAKRQELVVTSAANKRRLKEIEDRILATLSASEGNILEDASAIQILGDAKVVADEISEKEVVAEATAAEIEGATRSYTPAGAYNAVLFFCVADMGAVDPMYQYSLTWFIALFVRSIDDSRQAPGHGDGAEPSIEARLDQIADHFTYALYNNVCHSLFEKDKLIFSFLLATRLMGARGVLPQAEYDFLLTGVGAAAVGGAGHRPQRPAGQDWISAKMWGELCTLSDMGGSLSGLQAEVATQPAAWKAIFDSAEPHAAPLPGRIGEQANALQRLCVLRCLRPDRVVMGIQALVEGELGRRFVTPPLFSLAGSYAESAVDRPLLFVLSPGSDPTAALLKFAEDRDMSNRMWVISMGQGQGPKATTLIADALGVGGWVLLQNCHLAPSWMPALEKIYEGIKPESVDANFRLWMTSMPSSAFPVGILQNSVKMVTEPPAGVRANMGRAFALDPLSSPEWFESSSKPAVFKKLLFGLCFIHAFVLERRRFGPIGWNIPYSFDDGDLRISARQLLMYTEENEQVPFDALKYSIGECNYGGRVTDDKDRRLLNTLLDAVYQPDVLQPGFKLSSSGQYVIPPDGGIGDYVAAIGALPGVQRPEVFGLHDNADISKDLGQTAITLGALLQVGGGAGGGGAGGKDASVAELADDILRRLPPPFDIEKASARYPVLYEESMNQVLCQEMLRFNRLTAIIRDSLAALQKAVAGLQVMSAETEGVLGAMALGAVPAHWKAKSYPSLRPLAGYVADLLQRLAMLETWYQRGPPPAFWLPGFFFTPSFTTAALQNYARRNKLAIDAIGFDFEMVGMDTSALTRPPQDGIYVHGLYLEGCGWDPAASVLAESQPKVLFETAPVIWLRPRLLEDMTDYPHYECPVYRTSDRRGVLATTGHSTNFVMFIRMPSRQAQAHWIMRGVCMLLSLDD